MAEIEQASQIAEPQKLPQPETAKPAPAKSGNPFDGMIAKVRAATPAAVVNSGSQINLGLKASADVMSVWSSVRKGSASPNRLIASLITLASEVCGVFYKEKGVSDEKQLEYKQMGLPKYIAAKTMEGFNPKDHILETNGLATILNGVFMARSGMVQSVKGKVSWELWQGVMTTAAGLFMSYMPDRERAWQISHGIFFVRAPVAGKQAWDAYFTGVPEKGIAKGDWQQSAKWVLNQASNVVAELYGGVKKLPDGSIVKLGKDSAKDLPQNMMQRKGQAQASAADASSADAPPAPDVSAQADAAQQPSTKVDAVTQREAAMPERVKAHDEAQQQGQAASATA